MASVIISLGVVNTIIAAACSELAGPDEVGGLFGAMETVESGAGMIGPTIGGILYSYGLTPILVVVVGIYGAIFLAVLLYYRPFIVEYVAKRASVTLKDVHSGHTSDASDHHTNLSASTAVPSLSDKGNASTSVRPDDREPATKDKD
eukprot:gene2093-2493_t